MSQDQGMDVSPSWQELKDERDALSAHVERLREALIENKKLVYIKEGMKIEQARIHAETAVPRMDPTTSLARLKAEWQAEVLYQLLYEARDAREADTVRAFARNRVRALRRKAEVEEL